MQRFIELDTSIYWGAERCYCTVIPCGIKAQEFRGVVPVQIRAVEPQELAGKTLIAAPQPEAQQQRARRSYVSVSWLGTPVDASVALIGIAIPARYPASNTALNCGVQKKIILSCVRRLTNRAIANSRESYGQKTFL
jgi:hypothetical protein